MTDPSATPRYGAMIDAGGRCAALLGEATMPTVMGIAGVMVTIAGALITAAHRRRSYVGLGLALMLTGLTITAPTLWLR